MNIPPFDHLTQQYSLSTGTSSLTSVFIDWVNSQWCVCMLGTVVITTPFTSRLQSTDTQEREEREEKEERKRGVSCLVSRGWKSRLDGCDWRVCERERRRGEW